MNRISTRQFVASPACIPQWTLEQILPAYRDRLKLNKFEAFAGWAKSAVDWHKDAKPYVDLARQNGFRYTSMHLPAINGNDFDATLAEAISAARFAQAIGADVVLYKADTRENYIRGAKPFLDALQRDSIRVTPVLQNHKGTAITTLDDFREVIEGINDPRMQTLFEVGHFHRAGVKWQQGYEMLKGSIALVHINEITNDGKSVPFGTGDVDFKGLFEQLAKDDYTGNIVLELELETRNTDPERTLNCLVDAMKYLKQFCLEGASS